MYPQLPPPSQAHEYELSSGLAADRARTVVSIFALLRQLRIVCSSSAKNSSALEVHELPAVTPSIVTWLEHGTCNDPT